MSKHRFETWKKVKLGSHVLWKTSNGKVLPATVIRFTSPESYIGIRTNDGTEYEIWIEQINGMTKE